jgi:hypothetical protein
MFVSLAANPQTTPHTRSVSLQIQVTPPKLW